MNSKFLVWSYLIVLSLGTILNLYIPKNEAIAKDSIVIPGEAIRLRILANSDTAKDQEIKRMVRDAVNAEITLWVQDLTSMEKAKEVITSKLPEVQRIAENVVKEQGSNQSVNVEFGEKVQFPTKLYGQFLYPAGEYQAILITLGEGNGANWWCVLYPPLCFLDFSNGVAVRSDGFEDSAKEIKVAAAELDEAEVTEEPVVEEEQVIEESTVEKVVKKTVKKTVEEVKEEVKTEEKPVEKEAPVYTAEDEEPVKVKFFVVELFESIFN